ncbi:hypothetical protein G7048_26370 (plasmid) [Diaphorobacter sp. HDW4B]|uniref:hypothetical protein n=1 Tax=Diaphorobacter sp. HDW4B TaxID=2714925 RepID=UPI00140E5390|nr:hypothetical protein [Diaphorobacter sp. HDW4B]QIL74018.1 hypothetical protein G7048_26370 [Diaphorobacter sp. HDW4B]
MQKPFISVRGQAAMLWAGLATMVAYGLTIGFLMHMVPPPDATLSAAGVADFYRENNLGVRVGAVICSWISAFMIPTATVIALQMARLEKGIPCAVLSFAGGIMMSLFLVLPPLFWGVAAFTPSRPVEVTTLMHELGLLTLTTTDQIFIFQMIPLAWLSLVQKKHDPLSPFPRWVGYLTLWAALAFEVGAMAFLTKTGPFSWNGALVFWMPFCVFGLWITVVSFTMLKALKLQAIEEAKWGEA